MTRRMTLYQVCHTRAGDHFEPLGATMTTSKREALAELRMMRKHYPDAHLVQAVMTVCSDRPEAMKGRCLMDEVSYHVEVDNDGQGRRDCLESFIPSLRKAMTLLKEHQEKNPTAHLVKCVQTRYWEPPAVA